MTTQNHIFINRIILSAILVIIVNLLSAGKRQRQYMDDRGGRNKQI